MKKVRFRGLSFVACLVVVSSLWTASPAGAATVTYTDTIAPTTTSWVGSVSVPLFDPVLGTLNSVAFSLAGMVTGSVKFESLDAAPATVTSTLSAQIRLTRPDASLIAATTPSWSTLDNVSAFDGVIDFAGTSGMTHASLSASGAASATAPPPVSDLALFTGVGNIILPVYATGQSGATGPGNVVVQVNTFASADVKVVYDYTPAAQPHIKIIKYTNGEDANTPTGPVVSVGSTVTWTYVVTNDGDVDLTDVVVTDDKLGQICLIGPMAVGATHTCTTTGTAVAGQYANVGTVTGFYRQQQVNASDPSHYFAEERPCDWTKDEYGFFVVNRGILKPLVDGVPNFFCIPVAYKGLVDLNGNMVTDPVTGCQKMEYDWTNSEFMCIKRDAYFVQSVTLEKIHSMRKGACSFAWPNDYIRQQGKELATSEINICWPLLYETEGTKFVLSIVYQTNPAVPNLEGRSARVHKERYVWTVDWEAKDFSEFRARLMYFASVPAGACERFAIPQLELRKLLWLLDSYGCAEFGTYEAGIIPLLQTLPSDPLYLQNLQAAADKAALLEQYIDEDSCIDICGGFNTAAPCANLPVPDAVGILNDCTQPVGSVLLTDLYYAAHAAGLLQD